jgi:hypothetical protein
MDMLAFPVRFDSTGFKKHIDGSDEYYTQLLSICMLTEPMTHPFTPRFGVNDPAFRGIDKGLFVLNAARYVPEVKITSVLTTEDSDSNAKVTFAFDVLV